MKNLMESEQRMKIIVLAVLAALILGFEPFQTGFDLKGHLGWVTSHTSAEVIKATPDNSFVGYALRFASPSDHSYFDRYPLFFSAISRAILSPFENDLRHWIYLSRLYMDLLFLASLFYAYLITGHFLEDHLKRWSVVLLSFSGLYFLKYKAMLHYDQPAILGMLGLMNGIFLMEKTGNRKPFFRWAFIAPLMGRGYASLFLLVLYFGFKLVLNFRSIERCFEYLKLALFSLIPSGLICTLFLGYNILTEARIRNIPVSEVSIVKSAISRLGVEKFENPVQENNVQWSTFLFEQGKRLERHISPHLLGKSTGYILLFLIVLWIVYSQRKKCFSDLKNPQILFMILSGFFWILPMKRLAATHDYTTMYYFGLTIGIYILILKPISKPRIVFALSLLLFALSLNKVMRDQRKDLAKKNALGDEFHEIRQRLGGKDFLIYPEQGHANLLPGRPYILGFYFFDQKLTYDKGSSDFILSNKKLDLRPVFEGKSLFLYSAKEI